MTSYAAKLSPPQLYPVTEMHIDLTGKKALITGASQGLGKAIAMRLAGSGADVALLARTAGPLQDAQREIAQQTGRRVLAIACDVSQEAQIDQAWQTIEAEFNGVDILVNNAGTSFRRPLLAIQRSDLIRDMDLKLWAAMQFVQRAAPAMQQRHWGRVLNMVSIAGKTPPAGGAPTSVTRAAGIALTKVMAGELAVDNILVNAICVGWIETEQWKRFHQNERPDSDYDDYIRDRGRTIPVQRLGQASEVANLACFLASDQASYITGTAINADGGLSPVT